MRRWGGRKAQALTALCLETYGTRCWLQLPGCTGVATTADHVVPQSRGGSHELANLRPACSHCNSARGNRPPRQGRPPRPQPSRTW